jgi:hypothetical protein
VAVGRRFLHSSAPAPHPRNIRKLAGWAESEIAVSNTQSHTVEGSNARIDSVPAAARRRPPLRRAECPLAPPRCLPRLSPGLRRSHGAVVPLPPRARLPTSRPPPSPRPSRARGGAAQRGVALDEVVPDAGGVVVRHVVLHACKLTYSLTTKRSTYFLTTKTTHVLTHYLHARVGEAEAAFLEVVH